MNTQRWLAAAMAAALLLTLAACGGDDKNAADPAAAGTTAAVSTTAPPAETPAPTEDTAVQETPTDVKIAFITQEYEGANIAEIPYFEYDGDKNEVVDSINRLFSQGLQTRYEELLADTQGNALIEIRTYPFTDERYAQVVTTLYVYPDIGFSSMVESVNYDKTHNRWIQFSDLGISEDFIRSEVEKLYVPEYEGENIDSVAVVGFLLRPQGGEIGDFTEILLKLTTRRDGELSSSFYAYCPDTNEFYNFYLEAVVPFNHADMDNINPPLYYDQFEPQTGGEPMAEGVIYAGSSTESDPGDYLMALYSQFLQNIYSYGDDYSAENPMYIMYGEGLDIDGAECARFSVSGSFGSAEYAVDFANGDVYVLSEGGNSLLGRMELH